MKYPIAQLFVRPWTLSGISPELIESHYEVNYGGTVNRLNAITEQLDCLDRATTPPEVIQYGKRSLQPAGRAEQADANIAFQISVFPFRGELPCAAAIFFRKACPL